MENVTATPADVLMGKTAYMKNQDDPMPGTMQDCGNWSSGNLTAGAAITIPAGKHSGGGNVTAMSLAAQTSANATATQIRRGYTAWVNGQRIVGTLDIQSAINFSAAAVSYSQVKIRWQNPSRGPWEGVFIQMSTGGYPGAGGGNRVYTGVGNTAQAGAWSEIIIGGLTPKTTYYFTCTSYATGLDWGTQNNIACVTADSKIYLVNPASPQTVTWYKWYGPFTISSDRRVFHYKISNAASEDSDRRKWYMGLSSNASREDTNFLSDSPFWSIDHRAAKTIYGSKTVESWVTFDEKYIGKTYYIKFAPHGVGRGTLTMHYLYFDTV